MNSIDHNVGLHVQPASIQKLSPLSLFLFYSAMHISPTDSHSLPILPFNPPSSSKINTLIPPISTIPGCNATNFSLTSCVTSHRFAGTIGSVYVVSTLSSTNSTFSGDKTWRDTPKCAISPIWSDWCLADDAEKSMAGGGGNKIDMVGMLVEGAGTRGKMVEDEVIEEEVAWRNWDETGVMGLDDAAMIRSVVEDDNGENGRGAALETVLDARVMGVVGPMGGETATFGPEMPRDGGMLARTFRVRYCTPNLGGIGGVTRLRSSTGVVLAPTRKTTSKVDSAATSCGFISSTTKSHSHSGLSASSFLVFGGTGGRVDSIRALPAGEGGAALTVRVGGGTVEFGLGIGIRLFRVAVCNRPGS